MKACCFTGHRRIGKDELPWVQKRLEWTIERLIGEGVVYYGCGGALGFDILAGFAVLRLREKYEAVRLIMVLPCKNQDRRWSPDDQRDYRRLLQAADKIVYVSEEYYEGCMRQRNLHLVKHSSYCIAYCIREQSGTGQTVSFARKYGLEVFNIGREQGEI